MLMIGSFTTLANILSDDDNRELLKRKAREIVVMGGNFERYDGYYSFGGCNWTGEFNVIVDLKSSENVLRETDLPLSFVDFNQGLNVLLNLDDFRKGNPVEEIYRLSGFVDRPSWDVVALMYASGQYDEMFDRSPYGKAVLEAGGKNRVQSRRGSPPPDFVENSANESC